MARPRSQTTKRSTAAKSARPKTSSAKRTNAKRASAKSGTSASSKQSTQFKCPECGKTFGRAAGLGAHLKLSHGIAGSSKRTQTRQRAATETRGRPATTAGTTARSTTTGTRRRGRPPGSQNRPKTGTVNRDALLQALFPSGIPASEGTIRDLNTWLDEAERIAGSR